MTKGVLCIQSLSILFLIRPDIVLVGHGRAMVKVSHFIDSRHEECYIKREGSVIAVVRSMKKTTSSSGASQDLKERTEAAPSAPVVPGKHPTGAKQAASAHPPAPPNRRNRNQPRLTRGRKWVFCRLPPPSVPPISSVCFVSASSV